ncbi:MAG: hypothetical protein JWP88_997 [Flaviaesturariibacter sp.]|nr:hypothetical protein [Flaviaesturariibacter sp.]
MSQNTSTAGSIIYNVTSKVAAVIDRAWVQWMLEEHIPGMLQTGCFTGHKLVRLLEVDDSEGPTYAVQYFAKDLVEYDRYLREHSEALRQESLNKWGHQVIAFRSVMEVVA